MRFFLFLGAAVLVAGCAAQVLSANDRSVVVRARVQDVADAQRLADAECGKHGRKARLANKLTDNQYNFDCVN